MNTIIEKSGLKAIINHKGAELISLKDSREKEYIWGGNPEFWAKHSPVLFPIVGTLKNNAYSYQDKIYELTRHGFARDMDFTLLEKTENTAVFSLISTVETKKMYPFDFELQLKYTLAENKLTIKYTVINQNTDVLPFSIGAHPAFALNGKFENYTLAFEYEENLNSSQLQADLISDKTVAIKTDQNNLPLTYSLFENDALIFKKLKSRKISILENGKPFLRVSFDDFKNLGIWTKINAGFVCIEPWLGYSDTFKSSGNILEKEGIHFLNPYHTFQCQFSIEIL